MGLFMLSGDGRSTLLPSEGSRKDKPSTLINRKVVTLGGETSTEWKGMTSEGRSGVDVMVDAERSREVPRV